MSLKQILYFLNCIMPKRSKQIYFHSTCVYKDNIAAVLEEFLKHPVSENFSIVLDGDDLGEFQGSNIEHVKHRSLASIWKYMRSKYVIYDNGIYGSRSIRNQISVNTWHGIGLKKIGYYAFPTKTKYAQTATYGIAYSDFFRTTIAHAFGIPQENIIVSGEPRNDYFSIDNNSLEAIGINKSNYRNVIIWMPTYRISKVAKSGDDGAYYEYGIPLLNSNNIKILDNYLCNRKLLLIIKYHSLQDLLLPKIKFENIRFLTSEEVTKSKKPLYTLLSQCDALITDYSSVYLNYLILDRPICFAYDDLELYSSKRGFMFENVESMMPGFKANSFDQLLEFIDQLNLGMDNYRADRQIANKKFNKYNDNKNSYRLLKSIGILD